MSLIEVLMTIIVVAVSLGIALPPLQGVIADGRMQSARSRITVAFAQARQEAVARGREVALCPAGTDGRCADVTGWQHGWLGFEDGDGDGVRDSDEPQVASGEPTTGVTILATGGRRVVRFHPDSSAAGSNVTLTFCDRRGASHATALALNNAGRLRRVAVTPAYAANACAGD